MMLTLQPFATLPSFPDFGLDVVEVLVDYQGPILTELRSRSGESFLAYWCDSDENFNRWMYLRIDESKLVRMKIRKLAMDQVVPKATKDGFVFFLDVPSSGTPTDCKLVYLHDIPEDYKPAKAELLPTHFASSVSPNSLALPIDGTWGFKEWARIPKEFSWAYAFQFLEKLRGVDQYPSYQWRFKGGFSPAALGQWVLSQLGPSDRPKMTTVQYSSPGFIRFQVNDECRSMVLKTLNHYFSNKPPIETANKAISEYVKEFKLDDLKRGSEDWGKHDEKLRYLALVVWRSLDEESMGLSISRKISHSYEFVHVTRWFVRRLHKLSEYQNSGFVQFPE